jgi:hypothetical protein
MQNYKFDYKYQKKSDYNTKEKIEDQFFTKLISASNIAYAGHFKIIGDILSNETKIKTLISMPENKCYEIEKNDFNICIIAKDKVLHIQPVSEKKHSFNLVIENVYSHQLKSISKFLKHPDFCDTIDEVVKLEKGYFKSLKLEGVSFYCMLVNDYVSISGKEF